MYRLSTCDAPMAFDLPSGLSIRVRLVYPASILLEKDHGSEVADGHFLSDHCPVKVQTLDSQNAP